MFAMHRAIKGSERMIKVMRLIFVQFMLMVMLIGCHFFCDVQRFFWLFDVIVVLFIIDWLVLMMIMITFVIEMMVVVWIFNNVVYIMMMLDI